MAISVGWIPSVRARTQKAEGGVADLMENDTSVSGALSDLVPPDGVLVDVRAVSKKNLLEQLCRVAAGLKGLDESALLQAVLERERLGSTGVGAGAAIPHARARALDHMCAVFARLTDPIDFDAIDGRPADLVILLLAPEEAGAEHLKALAKVSRTFRNEHFRESLRSAPDADAVRTLLLDASPA